MCFVIPPHWSHHMGGSQYQVKCLLDEICGDDLDIYYLAREVNSDFKTNLYRVANINCDRSLCRNKLYFDILHLNKLLKEINPAVVYQRIGGAYTGFSAYYAKRSRCRFVWHIAHDDEVTPRNATKSLKLDIVDKRLLEYGIRHAHKIIAQTDIQRGLLRRYYNKDADAVVPNFHPYPSEKICKSDPVKIVWVANLKKWKQPEMFIRLSEDLITKGINNIECIMIGSPSKAKKWQTELQDSIRRIRILTYLGSKPIEIVNKILSESHIFVNTSKAEGFANTFIQAWMRNVPVISLHCNPDGVFNKEEVGYFAGTYERMLESVIKLVVNQDLRESMGKNAKEYAYKTHSVENAKQILDILLD